MGEFNESQKCDISKVNSPEDDATRKDREAIEQQEKNFFVLLTNAKKIQEVCKEKSVCLAEKKAKTLRVQKNKKKIKYSRATKATWDKLETQRLV